MKKIIHLLPNAHIDPVWLWDRSEGLNEGIRTCRAMVKLLEEFPGMVFNRGEAAIYAHVREFDPELFERIRELVELERWEIAGGNWVQTDHNMPATEVLFRQYREGQRYFREQFGRTAVTAWAPDSFGHAAGIPEILAANGFRYFSFMRPQRLELPDDLFRWIGDGGSGLLCCRLLSYTAEREVAAGLDRLAAREEGRPRRNIGVGFGLGDHGGGTSRGQIEGALAWASAHPEFEVRFSTFRQFFAALEAEIAAGLELPEVRGELNCCLRGCYASLPRFKAHYRRTEAALLRAERIGETVAALLDCPPPELGREWRMLLFNTFHDILPGTSIERAVEQQHDQLGAVADGALEAETAMLNRLAARIDMPVPASSAKHWPEATPMLVFNPLPRPFRGVIEVEACLDYRPLYRFSGKDPIVELRDAGGSELPVQEIKEEHNAMKHCVWRKRVAVPVELPPTGWKLLTVAARQEPKPYPLPPGPRAECSGEYEIRNRFWRISGRPGERCAVLTAADGSVLPLSFALYRDRFGSWGGMSEEPESFHLQELLEEWELRESRIVGTGPLRAGIWLRFDGAASHLELTLWLEADSPVIRAELRAFCRDRACRLKLRLPMAGQIVCDVPGAEVERREEGQFPAVGWLKLFLPGGTAFGFAADGAFSYDNENGFFTCGIAKRTLYAGDEIGGTLRYPELPVAGGEVKLRFLLSSDAGTIRQRAEELRMPPRVLCCWPHKGTLPAEGTLLAVEPDAVRILALSREKEAFHITLQNCSGQPVEARLSLLGRTGNIVLAPWKIVQVRL